MENQHDSKVKITNAGSTNTNIGSNNGNGTILSEQLSMLGGFDSSDTNKLFWNAHGSGGSIHLASNYVNMPVSKDSELYNMCHNKRGKAVIFNHEVFLPTLELSKRLGTERDKNNLKLTLEGIGFEVIVHNDLTFQELRSEVEKLSREDHTEKDCFLMCILSHGDTQLLYAKDYSYKPDFLWYSFTADKCPSLAAKPKLFFVQACQGNQLDEGTKLVRVSRRTEVDSNNQTYKIPNHADFLIAFSTVPGFYSWRNTSNGSWFIQAICNVLQKHGSKKDLLSMMTHVSREVALNFESNTPTIPQMHQKKQIPFITSTLIRDLYFLPKK